MFYLSEKMSLTAMETFCTVRERERKERERGLFESMFGDIERERERFESSSIWMNREGREMFESSSVWRERERERGDERENFIFNMIFI